MKLRIHLKIGDSWYMAISNHKYNTIHLYAMPIFWLTIFFFRWNSLVEEVSFKEYTFYKVAHVGLHWWAVVKNLLFPAGVVDSISGPGRSHMPQRNKDHAWQLLSQRGTRDKPTCHNWGPLQPSKYMSIFKSAHASYSNNATIFTWMLLI